MTDAPIDLSLYKQRRSRALLREQLTQSLARLPPVPNAGFHLGSFVKLGDGSRGWISEQRYTPSGALMLLVRVKGCGVWIMAKDAEPVRGA